MSFMEKGTKHSNESKQKMKTSRIGKRHSEETKRKIGLGNKGKVRSEEVRRNLSKKLKGRHVSPKTEFKKGRVPSEETRRKLSLANEGRFYSEETRKKLSLLHKGRIFSEEHKVKLKEARKYTVLPTKDTIIEIKIQDFLKQLEIEFFTHQYIKEIKHGYQCDILIPFLNIVIECDGNYWHKYPIGRDIDHMRTKELTEKGFKVLRLWEIDIIKMNIEDFQIKLKEI